MHHYALIYKNNVFSFSHEVGHSDPEKLKDAALGIQHLSPEELKQRQMEIKVRFIVCPMKILNEFISCCWIIKLCHSFCCSFTRAFCSGIQ